jgi:hypothetical protein
MLDQATQEESLTDWAKRNGIDLDDESPGIVGYWCRVAGVRLDDEKIRRNWKRGDLTEASEAWREADEEIRAEAIIDHD